MIKAFISHSSKQKAFVKELVEKLGRDFCIVDCYNFEPAYKTIDEIYKNIDKSSVFVLLLSKDSINSDWVDKEIRYARTKLQNEQIDRFWPFIVDDDLEIEDCPDWIRKDECFNLKKFDSPIMLARDIEQKFRKIIWSSDAKRKQIETLMVGRNADIDKFESIYLSSRGLNIKSLVISGRDGVGKDMFISQCLVKIGYDKEIIPYSINMGNNEGVEDFIIQLNEITRKFTSAELMDVLSQSPIEKAKTAANLLNILLDSRTVLTISDNMSCVQANRKLADWLVDLVDNAGMNNQLGLFIKSKKALITFGETDHPSFGHIKLEPLDTNDRTKLFYSLLRLYNINNISESDVKLFVEKLLLSPIQIVKTVEKLSVYPVSSVKRDIKELIDWGDQQINPFVSKFFVDEETKQLLIIMSKLDFVSYEILEGVFEVRIIEVMQTMNDLMDFGIVSTFGPNEQYFRLDHYFSDYIKRCNLRLPDDIDNLLNEVLEDVIVNSDDITEDISAFLYDKKQRIIAGKGCPEDFLVPSVVVASVVEVYNKKDYPSVISICDKVLNDVHNYYQEQERELRYWLCLALARKQNERFYVEVRNLKGADFHFLRGFYHRIAAEYSKAEYHLNKALEMSPELQRAKRELVTVLLAQGKYEQALAMAEENYKKHPENSYQIQGYFRCLVRKKGLNRNDFDVLEELMNAMKNNLSDKSEELLAAMEIEYNFFVKRTDITSMLQLIREAEIEYPNSINIKRAAQPFKYKQQIILKEELFPEEC